MKKPIMSIISALIITAMLLSVSAGARPGISCDEFGWYSFDKLMLVLKPEFSYDVKPVIEDLELYDEVEYAELSSAEGEIFEGYGAVIYVRFKEISESEFNKLYKELGEKEYVMLVGKSYYLSPPTIYFGDVDLDHKITTKDARLILRYATGIETPLTPIRAEIGDVDGDGKLTTNDARIVLRTAVGLEEIRVFPEQNG